MAMADTDKSIRMPRGQHFERYDSLRRELAAVRRVSSDLQEELTALRECLECSGILRRSQVAAMVHRRRFESVLRKTTCEWDLLLTDVLHVPGVLHPVLQFAGILALRPLACGTQLLRSLTEITQLPSVRPVRLYLIGGSSSDQQPLRSALRYDINTGKWEDVPEMPTKRNVLTAVSMNGQIYAIGGTDGDRPFSRVERYDTESNSWTSVRAMPTARGGLGVAVLGRHIYTIGGTDGRRSLGTTERFDVSTNQWQPLPGLAKPRRGVAGVAMDRYVYAIGGSDGSQALTTVERLNAENPTAWQAMPPLLTERRAGAAAALNGWIYVVGGASGVELQDPSLNTAEAFDSERQVWMALPPMLHPRRGLSLLVAEGCLYAFGGADRAQATNAFEVYKPAEGRWEKRPPMPVRRAYAGSAVVQTFEVLGFTIGQAAAQELRGTLAQVSHWISPPPTPLPRVHSSLLT